MRAPHRHGRTLWWPGSGCQLARGPAGGVRLQAKDSGVRRVLSIDVRMTGTIIQDMATLFHAAPLPRKRWVARKSAKKTDLLSRPSAAAPFAHLP